ncbi:MAG: GNAT family N-acetyltransferase, partial [Enterobacteriaceae bacterium]
MKSFLSHCRFSFIFNQNDPEVLAFLTARLRQTMNFHQMPGATFAVARNEQGNIIGLTGIDFDHSSMPEIFSRIVDDAWQQQGIGTILEYMVLRLAQCLHATTAFMRISSHDRTWQRVHKTPFHSVLISRQGIAAHLCERCNLYNNTCESRMFFTVAVDPRTTLLAGMIGEDERQPLEIIIDTHNQVLQKIALVRQVFTAIVGAENLLASTVPGAHQSCTFPVDMTLHYLVVRPASEDEVIACLTAASRHQLTFYVISQGKNWGYGSARPASAVDFVLDLGRLNRILEVNSEWGYATIQAGVTFSQLVEYLRQAYPEWLVDLTGGPVSGSVLGNALTKGHGLGPLGNHSDSIFNLSLVTPSGQRIQSGSGRFTLASKVKGLQGKFSGPDYDQLFIQSDFS